MEADQVRSPVGNMGVLETEVMMVLWFGEGVTLMFILRGEPWKWRWGRKPKA